MLKRIICFTPQKDNAISMYRSHGVLSEIHKIEPQLQVEFPETVHLKQLKGADVAFFLRPDTNEQLQYLKACKTMGLKIVVDYDDNLLSVPWHNKYKLIHLLNGVDYQAIVRDSLSLADLVIVSTQSLKDEFSKYNKNIQVLRNAYDNYIHKIKEERNVSNVILWRGSKFHNKDLPYFQDEINKLIDENPDFNFLFMGDLYPKWFIKPNRKNALFIKPVTVWEYQHTVHSMNVALTIVPLRYTGKETTLFNQGKSDIAKLELTAAGSLVVAPDWYEWNWNNDKSGLYQNKEEFYTKTTALIQSIRENKRELDLLWQSNIDYLKQNRLLSEVNKARAKLLLEL